LNAARPQGSYRSATAGPLDPLDVLYGHLLYIAFRLALSAAAFAAVLPLFDGFRTARVLLLVPSALLTGLAFACPMAAFAVSTAEAGRLTSFFRFVMMPLYMFSGTFFPVGQLPLPLRAVVWATPLWHGVELCRGALLGSLSPGPAALHIGYLAGCAAVFLVVARRAFRRRLHG
jgi:lipooligosaccharide transport system permease protein